MHGCQSSWLRSIVINEINYNSADSLFPKDWVELYNVTTEPINIGNWIFRDDNDGHEFLIPNNQILPPDGYIVICDSLNAFTILFPDIDNVIGDFDFKLKNDGELIRLFDDTGALIDSVHYNDVEPWPLEADGDGPTLELINPHYDNELASNWLASSGFGTPGQQNSNYIAVGQDCLGVWGGESEYDECGIGNGDSSTCLDCADVPNGGLLEDNCGTCDADSSNDCIQDCAGEWGGTAEENICGICEGTETDEVNCECSDGSDRDCAGLCAPDAGYGAEDDECGVCEGDNSTCADCADVPNGDAYFDYCGELCVVNNPSSDCSEYCDTDSSNDCVLDCAGEWGGSAIRDECEICVGGSTGVTPCVLSNSNKILPLDFNIRGIYPNPFNPVTTIGYTVPILTKVKLEVYNINGIKISVLIDDYISSGYHRVNWDASDHASGIYFVMMVVDDYIATQKLMLVK